MEKAKPRWGLSVVRTLAREGHWAASLSALAGAAGLGMDSAELLKTVMALAPADFHRSTRARADRRAWQDVYRTAGTRGAVELKCSVQTELLIASCKRLAP
jgi:hypothetical protein